MSYPKQLPVDRNSNTMQDFPAAFKALARYNGENAGASSVISLTHDTTTIEIAANGGGATMRWIATSDTTASVVSAEGSTANFDHAIAANTVRRFVVPKETGNVQMGSAVGINRQYGLYQRVAIKSNGVASVMTTEY